MDATTTSKRFTNQNFDKFKTELTLIGLTSIWQINRQNGTEIGK